MAEMSLYKRACVQFRGKTCVSMLCGLILGQIAIITLYAVSDVVHLLKPRTGFSTKVSGASNSIIASPHFSWKPFKVPDVDCAKLLSGNWRESAKAKTVKRISVPDVNVTADINKGCDEFLAHNGFITDPLTSEERDFPIAFSVLVYKDAAQVLRLLRIIYRPQNVYCIHVDKTSSSDFHVAMSSMVQCLNNVFLSSRSVNVRWGTFTVLEPELICMEDLLKYKRWKYFINLTGQEFPLKTNRELVDILTVFNGANAIITGNDTRARRRWANRPPVPFNLHVAKGSVHIAANRQFVEYVVNSPVAKAFSKWCKFIHVPDEEFFPSLNINSQLHIPGSFNGTIQQHYAFPIKHRIVRFKNWLLSNTPCAGRYVRDICILSVGDLPLLNTAYELFANKFHADKEGILATECLAEKLFNRTRDQTLGILNFDVEYYKNMPFLRNIQSGPSLEPTAG